MLSELDFPSLELGLREILTREKISFFLEKPLRVLVSAQNRGDLEAALSADKGRVPTPLWISEKIQETVGCKLIFHADTRRSRVRFYFRKVVALREQS